VWPGEFGPFKLFRGFGSLATTSVLVLPKVSRCFSTRFFLLLFFFLTQPNFLFIIFVLHRFVRV
jgi:hypothetical protein